MAVLAIWLIFLLGYLGADALLFLIVYGWVAPMAVHIWDMHAGRAALTVEFAMMVLIIGNLIAGVLLLIAWFIERSAGRKRMDACI